MRTSIPKGKSKLSGGFTRNITLSEMNGVPVVIKNYRRQIKPLFVDFSKSTFSLILKMPRISFLSKEDRILREVLGHEKLNKIGIAVPKILEFSFDDFYIAEEYIDGENLYNLVKNSEKSERENLAYQVGRITGQLHSMGYAFFDNRPQNYVLKDGKIFRIDLETFEFEPSSFEKYCDIISFTESFTGKTRNDIHESFISGYECYSKHMHSNIAEGLARRALSLLNLNRPKFRIGSPFHKNSIGPNSNSLSAFKHFFARHLRKTKSN